MKSQHDDLCPCNSGKPYEQCCKLFHDGVEKVKNACELMASRYSAYAKEHSEYIIQTTHTSHPQYNENKRSWLKEIDDFMKMTTFENLKIFDFTEEGNEAYVTFRAVLSVQGKDCSFTERSQFLKENEQWYYANGEIFEQI
ncbi:MAG: YchJ family protein [Candidatus Marinarcus sp.]|uniref:YchJ family protein n=1 Tax=Candidatus Marinarcus sp. TaxID=3100987 RepID=UPI003B002EBA